MSVSSLQRPSFWNYSRPTKKKVAFGSPSDGVLQRGDIISKIGNYDARDIRHQDAETLFKNSGGNVRIVVQRESSGRPNASIGSSRSSSRNYSSPLSVSPHLSPRGVSLQYSPAGSALTPMYGAPFEAVDDGYFAVIPDIRARQKDTGGEDLHVVNQPYRTTPLVLPGAKVKRDQGPTECYLRHHPNPAVRARPHQLVDYDYFLKQKLVNKQFNTPIGLYSDSNIADTLQRQAGAPGVRRPVKYDPTKSETLRAIQEQSVGDYMHEVNSPPQSKVYSPNKMIPGKKPHSSPGYQQPPQNNDIYSLGVPPEGIQQSHSFKRLMWSVLPETDY